MTVPHDLLLVLISSSDVYIKVKPVGSSSNEGTKNTIMHQVFLSHENVAFT